MEQSVNKKEPTLSGRGKAAERHESVLKKEMPPSTKKKRTEPLGGKESGRDLRGRCRSTQEEKI